jgi:fused signal recognition particle receptor
MAFDWFRRQHNEKEKQTPPPETQAPEPTAPIAAETPAVADDYLNWAKNAYQKIQQRQVEAAQSAEVQSELGAIAPESTAEVVQPEVAQSEPAAIVLESATETETPIATVIEPVAVEPVAVEVEPGIIEAEIPSETTLPIAEVVPVPEPTAPLPFWAQSEAERQARLEQLRQTAIVEPEPEVRPTSAAASAAATDTSLPETLPATPEFAFDEGFLWSAEVLAAQGRQAEDISIEEITWLKRLRQGLDKTRRGLVNQLRSIVGQGPLTEDAVMEIEAALLQADVGVAATDAIISALQKKLRDETLPSDAALTYLKQLLREMLDAPLAKSRHGFAPEKDKLNVWLITGVNGAGKTTTIGKLAHIATKSDYTCLIAAADTFRAAAVEQVKVWGSRSNVEVIANPGQNTDPAAVVFDAIAAAQSRGTELLLVDTAGRLQNKKNLMDELSKIRRIIDKKAEGAIVESLLVLDSTLGQNGLRQAEVFSQAAQLSGVVLTKLDGTAKGGIALAVVQQLGLPIRFIGAGEGIEDLRPFSSYEFVEALLNG